MSSRSLVSRLTMLQQVLAGALIVVFAGSAIWLTARTLERQETRFLADTAAHMAASLEREWNEEADLRRATRSALEEDAPLGVRIEVLDAAGRRVGSSAPGGRAATGDGMRELRVHLARGAWVVASTSTRPRRQAVTALALALLLTGLPLIGLVVVLSRALARRALAPLSLMAVEAERATAHGLTGPLGRPGDPAEVAVLAEAFDRLLARLDATLRAERHFTEDAAHELRTPLTVVAGELELALADPALASRQREGLRRAAEQARSMGDLVEALLFLRRTDPLRVAERTDLLPVDLGEVAREAVHEHLERLPGRRGDVRLEAADEVLVAGRPALLASALGNLLGNALKFTVAGQAVEIRVVAAGGACQVVVEDAGPGVPAEDRERIFDPFYRGRLSRAEHEGSGLGLTILRRIARAHGGDIECTASPLGGARFVLSLPGWMPGG